MSDDRYFDRFGRLCPMGPEDRAQPRKGIFALIVTAEAWCLTTWPAIATPSAELPGGGIEPGETHYDALLREIYEETGVVMDGELKTDKRYVQHVKLYAEDMPAFLDYDQEFRLIRLDEPPRDFFTYKRRNQEGGRAQWIPLNRLDDIAVHATHRPAIQTLLA